MGISKAHLAAIFAFTMWGTFPIYWKIFPEVGAWDLFAHRLCWSFLTLMAILFVRRDLGKLKKIWDEPKTRTLLLLSAVLISSNWLLYIYAIHIGKILEASMGYFLNPLLNVFMGWLILKEKIRPWQWPAISLGFIAIILMGVSTDLAHFPWIALTLSLTFALYGLIRKVAEVGSLEGLAFETTVVFMPTLIIWFFQPTTPMTLFTLIPTWKIVVLSLSGLITTLPLILFAYGAKRLPLSSLGFVQYLSPTFKFLCGWLIFDEILSPARLQAFGLIWIALGWYTLESFFNHKRSRRKEVLITE